ncbi:CBL-interacting serine/threonine-protein kinase 11 [Forsythia ovata]|uniref:non-specific serine/threonine protein kinase n=1 Tax=Forsythia ovata TaxID=205694 RepID=A0ABD1W752_9LAMI
MSMYQKIYKGEFRCPKWMSSDLKRFLSQLLDTNPTSRIAIDEIMRDPWFKKGYKEIKYCKNDENLDTMKEEYKKLVDLNAFDIISFSTEISLLGLFDDLHCAVGDVEQLTVAEMPHKVIEKVEEMVKCEKKNTVRLRRKKEFGIELEGQNVKFFIGLEVYRLTESLTVVEAKMISGEALDSLCCGRRKLGR